MLSGLLPMVLASLVLAPSPAFAEHGNRGSRVGYYDQAQVLEVVPVREIVRVSTPRQECWSEEVEHAPPYDDDGAYTVTGAILGGVIGHQFGGGSGRHVTTAAGSILGAVIGRDVGRRHGDDRTYTMVERRCRPVNDYHKAERIVGYRVTYDYQGRTYTTHMANHPGHYVRVRVSIDPVE